MSATQTPSRVSSSTQRTSMDRTRASMDRARTLSSSPASLPTKPEKTRKKLQKNHPSRRSASTNLSSSFKASANSVAQLPKSGAPSPPRVPPDLSDAKWQEYLRQSGVLSMDSPSAMPVLSPPRENVNGANGVENDRIPAIIPEFKHLAVNNTPSRPSLDSFGANSPTSSTSTVSSIRRQAKTPVTSIGQLEAETFGRKASDAGKVTSVDLIAAQYQALLEPSDADSVHTDSHSEPPPPRSDRRIITPDTGRQHSSGELHPPSAIPVPPPRHNALAKSPTSDDGTLVGFDEEAIYFKPLSFSPRLSSQLRPRESTYLRRSSVPQENFGLQLCTDLLTRELATAMLDRPGGNPDASALQILVMIEAYERLRDQVHEMGLRRDGFSGVETMFDTWLGALYSLHDTLSGESRSTNSDPSVHGLAFEDVD